MSHTAIDIVLLPPPALQKAVMAFNQSLVPTQGPIRFKSPDAPSGDGLGVVHLSLAMGVVPDTPLLNLIGEIISTAAAFPPMDLAVKGHRIFSEHEPWPLHWLEIEKTHLLDRLHRKMLDTIEGSLDTRFSANAFYCEAEEELPVRTIEYVRDYAATHSGAAFEPHFTMGIGDADGQLLPAAGSTFRFDTIAIYQMGPWCTCREEIARVTLEGI